VVFGRLNLQSFQAKNACFAFAGLHARDIIPVIEADGRLLNKGGGFPCRRFFIIKYWEIPCIDI
jgi:hypothetical protein